MRLFRTEGGPIVIVLRSEVWRGRSGAIVSTWDPDTSSVGLVLDTWTLRPDRDHALAISTAETTSPPLGDLRRYEIKGLTLDVIETGG